MKLSREEVRGLCFAYCCAVPWTLILGVALNAFSHFIGVGPLLEPFFEKATYLVVGLFFAAFVVAAALET